jgi:CHASE2 domain-containing sensor protein
MLNHSYLKFLLKPKHIYCIGAVYHMLSSKMQSQLSKSLGQKKNYSAEKDEFNLNKAGYPPHPPSHNIDWMNLSDHSIASYIAKSAISQEDIAKNDYELLRRSIGNARVVLIGEATHGTQDFYQTRADITKALIKHDPAFKFVGIEGGQHQFFQSFYPELKFQ